MQVLDELNAMLGIGPARARLPPALEAAGYQAVRSIGKGGFGQAHLLFQKHQSKYYVAKQINTSGMTNRQKKEAHNEISMLQQMSHPYIVKYVDYQEERTNLWIVMEYADGGDLAAHLNRVKASNKPLPEAEAMRLFTQTALALKHMHDRRMLHRDIKAQNVFLTKGLDVKLGDFGISTVLKTTMAMAQTVCGTPYYFSPELCAGRPYNNKSDIWALGVLLYNICSGGDMPFDATSMKALNEAIMKRQPRPLPVGFKQAYSKDVMDLLNQLLAKDSKKRPSIDGVLNSPAVQKNCAELVKRIAGDLGPSTDSHGSEGPHAANGSDDSPRRENAAPAAPRPPMPPPRHRVPMPPVAPPSASPAPPVARAAAAGREHDHDNNNHHDDDDAKAVMVAAPPPPPVRQPFRQRHAAAAAQEQQQHRAHADEGRLQAAMDAARDAASNDRHLPYLSPGGGPAAAGGGNQVSPLPSPSRHHQYLAAGGAGIGGGGARSPRPEAPAAAGFLPAIQKSPQGGADHHANHNNRQPEPYPPYQQYVRKPLVPAAKDGAAKDEPTPGRYFPAAQLLRQGNMSDSSKPYNKARPLWG